MKIVNEIIEGLKAYPKSLTLIRLYKLEKQVMLLLGIILLFALPVMAIGSFSKMISALIPFFNATKYTTIGIQFLSSITGFFLLIFLIPVFALVSETIHQKLTNKKLPFALKPFISDVLRGLKITLRNLFYEKAYLLPILLVLQILPENKLVSSLSSLLMALVTSYFYGFSMMDYTMENHRLNYKKSVKFSRSHKGLAIGLGLIYYAVITLNQTLLLGNVKMYWGVFAEAIIAFIGVIAANVVVSKRLLEK